MELQFQKKTLPCMREVLSQCREQELTQEVRLPDGMPDIGTVLGAWGQVIVRGKEWRPDSIAVTGGVMVWILYMTEENAELQVVETWLPYHVKWDIPDVQNDGSIVVAGRISFVDARSISARKFMLRTGICVNAQAYVSGDVYIYVPEQMPPDIQIKNNMYPMKLPAEIGEKPFTMDEPIPLPDECPEIEKIIRSSLQPEIIELKVLGGRIVFRGIANVHILYRSSDGMLHSCNVELPFSQYAQLDREYEEGADASVTPIITSLEIEIGENKVPYMKAGLSGQYMIRDHTVVELIEDAYSPEYDLEIQREQLQVPTILDECKQMINANRTIQIESDHVADVEFMPQNPEESIGSAGNELNLSGRFLALYYDGNGQLLSANTKWEDRCSVQSGENVRLHSWVIPAGKPMATVDSSVTLHGQLLMDSVYIASQGLEMISGIKLKERKEKREDRPSLVVRRAGEDDLWTIAKTVGSTVDAICEANGITDEPDKDQMLLIPIL